MAVALVYFAYLAAMALAARLKPRPTVGRNFSSAEVVPGRQWRVLIVSLAAIASILAIGMRHIMPLIYLLIGYWLPALLVRVPNTRLEQGLLRFDRQLFGSDGLESFADRAPRVLLEYFELAYLFCYAVVPMGFVWLVLAGFESEADRFWSTVFLASFGCYGLLPWLPTRAPRALGRPPVRTRSSVRKLNLHVLDRASVQWNTFPSGHTAASVAAALAVGTDVPQAGWVLGLIAVSIAVGSVVGRYHYAADAITGALIAIVAFLMTSAAHAP